MTGATPGREPGGISTGSFPILHRDDDLLAVDKPPGIAVIPARGEAPEASLVQRLSSELGVRLWVVHRIDRDTSGVVVFALNADTHRALSLAFERHEVEKTYLAFAAGDLPASARVDVPLHAARRGKARPARGHERGALAAVTELAVTARYHIAETPVCRVEARPLTGRHHQIRVHLRALGAPVLFDETYGRAIPREPFAAAPCRRLALHASGIRVPRPGGSLEIACPPPPDLVALEAWLAASGAPGSAENAEGIPGL